MRNTRSFLFATFEGGGSVTPALTVVRELVRRGHRVRMMSDPCNRPESEAAGAAFVPWTRAPGKAERMRECDTFSDWDAADAAEGFMMLMDSVLTGPSLAFAEDVIAELRREPADLVVSSEMLFGVHAACEAIGQELALLAVNIGLFPIPGIPPMGPGLAPARTAEEHAVHAAITRGTMELLNGRALPALNRARAALGLPALTSLVDQHRAARVLMLATARAFDFAPAALPPHIAYVGPQLGEPAWAAPWQSPFAAGDARPLVLVSFSTTFQNHLGPLQRVIDALATLPVKAVVTLGGSIY
ncbi:MAG: glycosyltransferase, partial [Alphaproteobacteria bacterium]